MKRYAHGLAMIVCALLLSSCKEDLKQPAYGQTVDLTLDPATVESGNTSAITAMVKEDLSPKIGVKVSFSASGNCGSFSSPSATTESGLEQGPVQQGQAQVIFKTNSPYMTCTAVVTASAKTSATAMLTVTPKVLQGSVPISQIDAGAQPPTVQLQPELQQPVSAGFSAKYTITSSGSNILSVRCVSSRKCSYSSDNGVAVNPISSEPNGVDLVEPSANVYDTDVLSVTSDSKHLGTLDLVVSLKNPNGGAPLEVRFQDPSTKKSLVPGPA
jgi:hypothetical protein